MDRSSRFCLKRMEEAEAGESREADMRQAEFPAIGEAYNSLLTYCRLKIKL